MKIRVQVGSDDMSQFIRMVQLDRVEKLSWEQLTEDRGLVYRKKEQRKLGLLVRTQVSMMKDYRPLISRIGWNSLDGHDFYCLGTELYGVENIAVSDELMAEYPRLNQRDMCGVNETLEKVCVLLKNGNPVTYVCFLTMLYSVLRKLFERAGVFKKYVLYIYGETATYKTSVAKFFTVWRREWKSKPIISMESTREAREQEILHFNDCLYLLDDLAPVEQKSNQKMRNDVLASLIRSIANGEGRKKGGADGEATDEGCVESVSGAGRRSESGRKRRNKRMEPMKNIPVYRHSAAYAVEHGELEAYKTSRVAGVACRDAIEKAVAKHYRDNCLNKAGAREVIDEFGKERVMTVLAITIRDKLYDGRFSSANKAWAQAFPIEPDIDSWGGNRNLTLVVRQTHPGLLNLFCDQAKAYESEKVSVREKLKAAAKNAPVPSTKNEMER